MARFLAEAILISGLVSLMAQSFPANADDHKKLVIKDVNGRTVTSTRTLENGTVVLRDAYGRNVGFATKNQDGSYTIKTAYGQRVGTVKEQD